MARAKAPFHALIISLTFAMSGAVALAQIVAPKSIDVQLRNLRKSTGASTRYLAAREISSRCRTEECTTALISALESDPDHLVRSAAAWGLHDRGAPAEAVLRGALSGESNAAVLESILLSLESLAYERRGLEPDTVRVAVAAYSPGEPENVRYATARLVEQALAFAPAGDSRQALIDLALRALPLESQESMQKAWVFALAKSGDEERVIAFLSSMVRAKSLSSSARGWAVDHLAGFGDIGWRLSRADKAKLFVELLDDADSSIRLTAAHALAEAVPVEGGDAAAFEALICQGLAKVRELAKPVLGETLNQKNAREHVEFMLPVYEKNWKSSCNS